MAGFLDALRKKIVLNVDKGHQEVAADAGLDDKIALGVLMWVVAQADDQFLAQEKDKIGQILREFAQIETNQLSYVMKAVELAAEQRIDLYSFAKEASSDLPYARKVFVIENLFRVACIDKNLDNAEHEMIRKISGLLQIDHKNFIDAKIKVKKECGLDTAG